MKLLMVAVIGLLLSAAAIVWNVAEREKPPSDLPASSVSGTSIYKHVVDGHLYLVMSGLYKGGIIHAESCTNSACAPANR